MLKLQVYLASMLMISSIGLAQTSNPDSDLNSDSAQLLMKDLGSAVKILPSEKIMFSYFRATIPSNSSEGKKPEARTQYINRHSQSITQKFWSLSHETSGFHMGSGFYLAIDPLISSDLSPVSANRFGLDVVEIKLPAGTKYFSVARPIKLSEQTLSALVQEGYLGLNDLSLFNYTKGSETRTQVMSRDVFKNYTQARYLKFKKLMLKIFASNNITAIEYNWNSSLDYFCKSAKKVAFVLIGQPQSLENFSNVSLSGFSFTGVFDDVLSNKTQQEIESEQRTVKLRTILHSQSKAGSVGAADILSQVDASFVDQVRAETFSCN